MLNCNYLGYLAQVIWHVRYHFEGYEVSDAIGHIRGGNLKIVCNFDPLLYLDIFSKFKQPPPELSLEKNADGPTRLG